MGGILLLKIKDFVRFNKVLPVLLAFIGASEIFAQNYPLYDGYFLNPYIYNPAAAATERVQINAGYRRQWFGISGAPTIATLTGTVLLDETRAGVGFQINSFSRGFLNSTNASLSYAYGIPLSTKNRLFFGLSGGVLSNTVNLNDVKAVSDPSLSTLSSSMIPSASFGMLLKNTNGLNFGISLPKLLTDQNLDARYSFSFFDNAILTASFSKWNPKPQVIKKGKSKSYKRGSKKEVSIPLEVFSVYRYSVFGSLFEGTVKYNFSPNIWLSAGYRQYSGFIPGIGFSTDDISFSYFYEPGFGGDLPLKTHDLLLTLRLGQVRKFRDKKPIPPPTKIASVAPVNHQSKFVQKTQPVVTPVQKNQTKQQPVVIAKNDTAKKTPVVVQQPVHKINNPATQHETLPKVHTDTVAQRKAHEEERKALDKHLEDHSEGKHDDVHDHPANERHDFVKRGTHHEELDAATYVISGAFQSRANAEHYAKTLTSLGYKSDFGHLSVRNIWYVFVAQEGEIDAAKAERERLRKNKILSQVWLLTVQ